MTITVTLPADVLAEIDSNPDVAILLRYCDRGRCRLG